MKNALRFAAVCCFFVVPFWVFGQNFQRQFGTTFDNSFSKIIQSGSNFYVLGQNQTAQGATSRATVSLLNSSGQLQWTRSLDVASVWNDGVLTPSGGLLLVGSTLPVNASNKSLIGLLTAGGSFTWVKSYSSGGNETLNRIIRSPSPQNASFPYYAVGTQVGANNKKQVVLLNLSESSSTTFNWRKAWQNNPANDDFARDMEVFPNGDLAICGQNGTQGVVLKLDKTGQFIGGATPSGLSISYSAMALDGSGGLYAVSGPLGGVCYLTKFNTDLINVWETKILGLSAITQVFRDPNSTDVFVVGNGQFGGKLRPVICRFVDAGTAPVLLWMKYLDNGATSYSGGFAIALSGDRVGYTDARIPATGGFGQLCAFFSTSSPDLMPSCMTVESTISIEIVSQIYNGPDPGSISFTDVPQSPTDVANSSITWQQADACSIACNATMTVTPQNSCGDYQATVSGAVSQLWCNGSTTATITIHSCAAVTFCVTATCSTGANTVLSQSFPAADLIKPTIVCPQNTSVSCPTDAIPANTGMATATDNCPGPITITYSDVLSGAVPCDAVILRTWKAVDACGNSATCQQSILVQDLIPPIITNCPSGTMTLPTAAGQCFATLPTVPTVFDNCDPNPTVICSYELPSGQQVPLSPNTQIPKGTYKVNWQAIDLCGNVGFCQFGLIVKDNEALTFICQQSQTVVGTLTGQPPICKATVNGLTPMVTDNCPMVTVSYSISGATTAAGSGDASGTMFMQGVSTVTYTATDMGGNIKTCSFTIDVKCQAASDFPGFRCGEAVVSCFSGFLPNTTTPDPNGPVIALIDLRQHALAPLGMDWPIAATPKIYHKSDWIGQNMGQVFGVTIDNLDNVYASATTIYGKYLSPPLTNAAFGNVYKIDATTGNFSVFATLPQDLANPAGLGDVWYDAPNNQFFVSNFYDGLIYRLSAAGAILSTYDFVGPNYGTPSPGFIPRGNRVWAVATHNNRLYFSVWNEDRARQLTTVKNQIYSVPLVAGDPTGGIAVLEKDMPSLVTNVPLDWSSPVSDIHFSSTGKMLVAERSMNNDFGDAAANVGSQAHAARIIELSGAGWANEKLFYVGNAGTPNANFANSAGGTDYGYESFVPAAMPKPEKCDSMVWGSGDALRYPGYNVIADASGLLCGNGIGDRVYGVAGMRASGNSNNPSAPNYVRNTSIYIDLDNNLCLGAKVQVGDLDIFDCGCAKGASVCDSISVTSMPFNGPKDTCCFKLTVTNQKPNYFTAIQLCAQNGVSISDVMALNGWSLLGYTASMVTLVPPGGLPTPIPVGTTDFLKFCLSNYQIVTNQQVIVKYYDSNFEVVCMDTLNYNCTQKPKCLKVTTEVDCADNGTYKMTFCVMSNAQIAFNVGSFVLNAPPGITFTPNTFTPNPNPLLPGQMQCNFMTTVSGAVDGQTICFSVTAHQPAGQQLIQCCTDTVMLACATMPTCICNKVSATATAVSLPGNNCCWKVNLTNAYSNTYFTGIQLDILTSGVVFGAINNFIGSGWGLSFSPTQAIFPKINPGGTFIGATAMLPTFCLSGITLPSQIPQVVVVSWLGPNGQIICRDTLYFDCQPPIETDCALLVNPKIECDLASPGGYTFTFQVYNGTNPAFTINQVTLGSVTPFGSIVPTVFNIPPLGYGQTSGVITTSINGVLPGGQVCFYLTVHEVGPNGVELNCCTNSQKYCFTLPPWPEECQCGPFNLTLVYGTAASHGVAKLNCGDTFIVPPAQQTTFTLYSSFQCVGLNCLPATVDWTLTGPTGFTTQMMTNVPATPAFNIPISWATFSLAGTYTLTMTGHCGTNLCPCVITFISKPDSCECLGFDGLSFYNFLGLPDISVTCNNQSPLSLPCIGSDAYYSFQGMLHCSADTCPSKVNWAIMQNGQTVSSGTTTTAPGGGYFSLIFFHSNFNGPGNYTLMLTGICGDDTCKCNIALVIPDCPMGCACGSFSNLILHSGAASFPMNCGNMPPFVPCPPAGIPFVVQGLFQCVGNNCPPAMVNWMFIAPDGTVTNSPSPIVANPNFSINLPISYFPSNGVYCLKLTGSCNGVACPPCTIKFSIECPPPVLCECKQSATVNLNQNGVSYYIGCGQGPFTPVIPCPAGSVTIAGDFGCVTSTGASCQPPSVIAWSLSTSAGVFIANETTPSPLSLNLPAVLVSAAGGYKLTLTTLCPGQTDSCMCMARWIQEDCNQDSCCKNMMTFCKNVENAVSISPDHAHCKATVNVTNLPPCDEIQSINWGDGSPIANGPFANGSMAMHTYSTTGQHIICVFAVEKNLQVTPPSICFQKTVCDTFLLDCPQVDTCGCGGFSNLYARKGPLGAHEPQTCGSPNVFLMDNCPQLGFSYVFGDFSCVGTGCLNYAVVDYEVVKVPSGMPVISGSTIANPYFIFSLYSPLLTSGDYEIRLKGHCGTKICECVLKMKVVCPETCTCDMLKMNVAQGFHTLGTKNSCKRTFLPIALCPTDMVTWTLDGQMISTTMGNGSFMYSFPMSGIYTVCMMVKRTLPDGTVCPIAEYCRKIKVKCLGFPDPPLSSCATNAIKNGDFTEGVVAGELGKNGQMTDWTLFPNTGDGHVFVNDTAGSSEAGHLILSGNQGSFAGVFQPLDASVSSNDMFTTIEYDIHNYVGKAIPIGSELEFRLQKEPILGSPSQILFTLALDSSSAGWQNRLESIPLKPDSDKKWLVICVRNSVDNANTVLGLDNLTICLPKPSKTDQPVLSKIIRLFPNPNGGSFNIELPEPASASLFFKIVDLTGRVLLEKQAEKGQSRQPIQTNLLPQGFYFVQVWEANRLLAVEKMVKQ